MKAILLTAPLCSCLPHAIHVNVGTQDHWMGSSAGPDTVESTWIEVGGSWYLKPIPVE